MANRRKLTLLHSNDMHGDFMAESIDEQLVGGVSMLSGYINQVRHEEENVIYSISGDMFRGSLIDSEYRGLSTIEIMNMLTPDIATLGNHEVDYGISHLLFLEKCAKFPIINANIYIKMNHVRLFQSHKILNVNGIKILFIGILTQEVIAQTKQEAIIGSFIDVADAAEEIGKICDSYQTEDIDFTVLLTHIGIEADKKLASMLDPKWGVDLILGGHSHTYMTEPVVVAGIPIVQTASGTNQIGRFDIMVDMDENCIDSYTWELVPVDEKHCPRDIVLEEVIDRYRNATEEKYSRYITRFADRYTQVRRDRESELGKIFADALRDCLELDIMLVGSGSLRMDSMGPIVNYQALVEMFPYNDEIIRVVLTGEQLKHAIRYLFRSEALVEGAHTEFYQFSRGIHFAINFTTGVLSEITFYGKEIDDKKTYNVGMQAFHYNNMEAFFGITEDEIKKTKMPRVVATKSIDVLDEWLGNQELVKVSSEKRWETIL